MTSVAFTIRSTMATALHGAGAGVDGMVGEAGMVGVPTIVPIGVGVVLGTTLGMDPLGADHIGHGIPLIGCLRMQKEVPLVDG